MKPIRLIQFQITPDLPQKDIRWLAKNVLARDTLWHFFHEGSYCLIRTTGDSKNLHKWLRTRGRKGKLIYNTRPYEDPHPLVRKYQDLFIPMFHSFTLLGLEYGAGITKLSELDDWYSIFDRITHCYCNMSGLDPRSEIHRMSVEAVGRQTFLTTHYAGIAFDRMQKLEEEIKKLKETK